ncbi:MAG: septum formation initiator family protein [Candidatus Magasanikbacteria bacterium]|jgi:cell division protein FtsB|nr:septum formation initiator family protein [Candidatus Magasanikbacteria bacterium]MBT4071295.1 septum formation initiator family protein [Candidatus Magasanikbacteria bacterium]
MVKQAQEHILRRFFSSRLFLVIAFSILVLVAFGYIRAYYQDYQIKQEIKQLEEDVQSLERKKLESMDILQYVMSDEFVEEKARTELNMKKPGEHMLFVQQPYGEEDEHLTSDLSTGQYTPNPVKWWYYFTHKLKN